MGLLWDVFRQRLDFFILRRLVHLPVTRNSLVRFDTRLIAQPVSARKINKTLTAA